MSWLETGTSRTQVVHVKTAINYIANYPTLHSTLKWRENYESHSYLAAKKKSAPVYGVFQFSWGLSEREAYIIFRDVPKPRGALGLPATTEWGEDNAVRKREPQTIVVSVAVWWVRTPVPLYYDLLPQDILSRAKFQPVVNIRVNCVFGWVSNLKLQHEASYV